MEKIKRKNLKHSYSDKIKVLELYNQGYGSTHISKVLHISVTVVKTWLCIYRSRGVLGFEKSAKQLLSIELKEQVVQDVL